MALNMAMLLESIMAMDIPTKRELVSTYLSQAKRAAPHALNDLCVI